MKRAVPYWEKGGDWSQQGFFIERVETKLPIEATEIPCTKLPCFAFLFLLDGEMLAEIDGDPYLCRGGQLLLIPEGIPFSVHHYTDLVGYTGGFSLAFLRDVSYGCLTSGRPTVCTFWFDNAAFFAQIMERMTAALFRGDDGYLVRAMDLILYSMEQHVKFKAHPLVNQFLELLFDRSQEIVSVSGYAERLGISPSYLNKLVRTQTRHSAMDWVEISRVNWAKSLLKDSDMSVGEVSLAIGVDDPSYFTRFFRKSTGMTPSEFRRQMAKEGKRP